MTKTIDIPGGTATIYTVDELTPRRQRAMQVISLMAGSALKKFRAAKTLTMPDGTVKNADGTTAAPTVEEKEEAAIDQLANANLTEAEATVFFKIQDASIYAHLKDWTLTDGNGAPLPRPETVDAVQDIPGPVYDALSAEINALNDTNEADSFEPNEATAADPNSPFGSSGDSGTSSPEIPAVS